MQPLEHRNLTGRLTEHLLQLIEGGELANRKLPSEVNLARQLGVSRTSLREALLQLEQQGVIIRRHGYGTFVRGSGVLHNNLSRNLSATELIRGQGMEPGTRDTRMEQRAANAHEAERLGVVEGSPIVVMERLRTANGRPVVLTIDVIPAELFRAAGVEPEQLTEPGISVYRFFAERLGRSVFDGQASLRVELASRQLGARLEVAPGTPLLVIEQLDFDAAESPVLLSYETYVTDAFEFAIHRRGPGLPSRTVLGGR